MKGILKVVGALLGLTVLTAVGAAAYIVTFLPDLGPLPDLKVVADEASIERGRYLAWHVAACIDCHSERDWDYFAGPIKEGTAGKGGEVFPRKMGLPGDLYAANITPAYLGDASDAELARAITMGVGKGNRPLFPLMPYPAYAGLSERDLHALIAYLRTLAPIENPVPATQLDFPVSILVHTMPVAVKPGPEPDRTNEVAYGEYLVRIAACAECHTTMERGAPLPGMTLAGGNPFALREGTVRSANLTPDDETGLGRMDRATFIGLFRRFAGGDSGRRTVADMGYQSIMPWPVYSGMTEEDLGAIFAYLRTVPAVAHPVERFTRN